jgi:hypothetical protein
MNKRIDIFIKSYRNDFWLLQIALKSIARNVTGYNTIVLLIPEKDKHDFDTRILPERTLIHYIDDKTPGWLYQQVCKLQAYKYSYADYIVFSDSDAFWYKPVNVQDLVKDDKPEILFTHYSQLPDAIIWKKPTEEILGVTVEYEYMRRLPLCYHRSTLEELNIKYPNLEEIIMSSPRFSEFNLLGAFAVNNHPEKYTWINTDDWKFVPATVNQVWSHANKKEGASETHLREYIRLLEGILNSYGIDVP